MIQPRLLLLGKLPPPYMGPAVATSILLKSKLADHFDIVHVNTNVHETIATVGDVNLGKIARNTSIYYRFLRALLRHRPDVVLVPISQATIGFVKDSFFILVSRLLGRPVVLHLRGSNLLNWLDECGALVRKFVEFVLRSAQGGIVVGHGLRYIFEKYLPAERVFVVPNGADFPGLEDRTRASNESRSVLYLANLMPSKGIEDVVRAADILLKRGVGGFRLDVVGQWSDEATQARCLAMVSDGNLPVVFHGVAAGERKEAFLKSADLLVFVPREPEGHPWVIVEALAAGLPVITTDQGAIRECVIDGRNGFIVPTEDAHAVAEKIETLLGDNALRSDMGGESRAMYEKAYTEDAMVSHLTAALRSVLQLEGSAVMSPTV